MLWRGASFVRLLNYDAALPDIYRAIEINPAHFDSYRMIDYLYARDQQRDTVISYWTAFLDHEPENALAYLERAGSYHHNRNEILARHDLEKACKLLKRY